MDEFDTDYDSSWFDEAHRLLHELMILAGEDKMRQLKIGELALHLSAYLLKVSNSTLTLH